MSSSLYASAHTWSSTVIIINTQKNVFKNVYNMKLIFNDILGLYVD